jgi:hypothetical protein
VYENITFMLPVALADSLICGVSLENVSSCDDFRPLVFNLTYKVIIRQIFLCNSCTVSLWSKLAPVILELCYS